MPTALPTLLPDPAARERSRLLSRVFRGFVLALGVSFLLFAAYSWWHLQQEAERRVNALTAQFVNMVRAEFGQQEAMLRLLGSQLLAMGALERPEAGRALIDEMLALNPAMAGFGLARPDGQLVLVSRIPPGKPLPNLVQREASRHGFLEALRERRMVVGRTYFFDLVQRWLIPVRLALRRDGQVVAVMAAGLDLAAPEALWNLVRLAPGEAVTLVRDDGFIQLRRSHPPPDLEALHARPVAWNRKRAGDPLDPDALARSEYLPDWHLTVVASIDRREILGSYLSRMMTPAILFLGGVLVSYFFFRSAARSQQHYERRLIHQATHDALTGMPNRSLIHDRLRVALAQARRRRGQVAVMYLDLDNFKQVNDHYGHPAGDRLLEAVAGRLREVLRDGDSLGRVGGDEFVVLVNDLRGPQDAEALAGRIRAAFRRPFDLDGREYFTSVSIGIALFPDNGDEPSALLSHADAALYRAKAEGRDCVCFFEPHFDQESERRALIEQGLRQAVARGELSLLYQPKVEAASGRWVGAEALLRWRSPQLGEVSPGEFIPVAEQSGLIVELGDHVLRQALRDLQRIQARVPDFQVAVNVSVRQFHDPEFLVRLMQQVQETDTDPHCLELEVTESIMAQPFAELELLRDAGLSLAIDDFGTGFSSLAALKRLPVTTLKIDRAFVRDIEADPADKALVTAMIAVARELDLLLVAEGVESEGQAAWLRAQGCDQLQGYLFSRPVPLEALLDGLRANRDGAAQPPFSAR